METDIYTQTSALNDIVEQATAETHKDPQAEQALKFILRPCNWVNPSFADHPDRDQYVQLVTMLSVLSAIQGEGLEIPIVRLIREVAKRLKENHDPIGCCPG